MDAFLGSGRDDAERFCELLTDHLRTLMLLSVCGADTDLVDVPGSLRERLAEQAGRFDAPTYVYMIALGHELRRTVKSSGGGRALLDAAAVRLAMSEQFSDIKAALASAGTAPAVAQKKSGPPAVPRPASIAACRPGAGACQACCHTAAFDQGTFGGIAGGAHCGCQPRRQGQGRNRPGRSPGDGLVRRLSGRRAGQGQRRGRRRAKRHSRR